MNRWTTTLMVALVGVLGMTDDPALAQEANYDESKMPSFTLPDPLVNLAGEKITDPKQWPARRQEIVQLFATHMFGQRPEVAFQQTNGVRDLSSTEIDGAGSVQIVQIRLQCEERELTFPVLLVLPISDEPVPVFVAPNFHGLHTVAIHPQLPLPTGWVPSWEGSRDNKATESQRGQSSSRWPLSLILKKGYGVATVYYGDIDADRDDDFAAGVHQLLDGDNRTADWASISGWAWGLSRIMDYLATDPRVDSGRVIVAGHSRLGKTALWAGATDPRFAMVISNNSGCGGAALSRRRIGESVQRINTTFPHWFNDRFKDYNENEDDCPVDQHMLIAALAPRPVYIASATEDRWADPKGEFLSGVHATPVYQMLGLPGLELDEFPRPEQPCFSRIGYHLREGKHDVTEYDWTQFIRFADLHLEP